MKLHKYQEGGAFTSPFIADKYKVQQGQYVKERNIFNPKADATTKKNKIKDIVDDTLFNSAINKGLSNEVDQLIMMRENLISKVQTGDYTARDISNTMSTINKIINNASERDEAESDLSKNEARDDIYFTENNQVLVQDDNGSMVKVPASKYLQYSPEERAKFKLITNSEMFNMRSKSKGLAFDTTVFNTLKQAPTTKQYYEEVTDLLNNVQSDKFKASLKDLPPDVRKQMLAYKSAVEEGDQNKIHQIVSGKTFISGINRSINSKINPRLKNYMKLVAGMNGNSLEKYLSDIVNSHLGFSDVQYTDKSSGKSGGGSSSTSLEKSDFNNKVSRRTGVSEVLPVNTGSDMNLMLSGETYTQLQVNEAGKTKGIEPTTMDKALNISGLDVMIDKSKVYVGDKKISSDQYDAVMGGLIYNNSSVMTTDIPVDANGNIDFKLTETISKLLKESNDVVKLNEKLGELHIPGTFRTKRNADGSKGSVMFTGANTKSFIVLTANEVDGDIIDVDSNDMSTLLPDDKKASVLTTYEKILDGRKDMEDSRSGAFNWSHPVKAAPVFLQMSKSPTFDTNAFYQPKVDLNQTKVVNQMQHKKINTDLSLDSL